MNDPVMQNISSPDTPRGTPSSRGDGWGSLVTYLAVTLAIALFVRFFIATPYIVQGASMEPTFDNYHYLIIDRIAYRLHEPVRGDVIVFNMPNDTGRALIKRVIGLPGETVVLSGPNPTVTIYNSLHPEGFTLQEQYLDPENFGGASDLKITLGADQYFVLGDNRRVSADSRLWGVLPAENIVGRVFLRLYPFTKLGVLPGEQRYND